MLNGFLLYYKKERSRKCGVLKKMLDNSFCFDGGVKIEKINLNRTTIHINFNNP